MAANGLGALAIAISGTVAIGLMVYRIVTLYLYGLQPHLAEDLLVLVACTVGLIVGVCIHVQGPCRYARKCEYYNDENTICRSATAENGFCGKYRKFVEGECAET